MKRATVVKSFSGRPDNETNTRLIEVGECIDGDLAEVAIREKWAKELADKPVAAPGKKASAASAKKSAGA